MKISVVICTFNRPEDCIETVQSILDQANTYLHEIIVVDDCSKSPFKFNHDKVKIIRNNREVGLSASRNIGVKASSGDIICFIDDDAIAAPDWIKRIQDTICNGADIVGGIAEPLYLSPPPKWWVADLFGFFVGIKNKDIIGTNFAVKKEVFNKIGYFNEDLGRKGGILISCEEIEFRERAKKAGLKLMFDENIKVYHKVSSKKMTISYLIYRAWGQGISKVILKKSKEKSISPSVFPFSKKSLYIFVKAIRHKIVLLPIVLVLIFFLKIVFWISVFYFSYFNKLD